MSEEDVLLAKGRTHDEYVQCKMHFSVLESESRRVATVLERVCTFLRSGGKEPFSTGGLEEVLLGKTISLMNDLHETRHRREVLRESLIGMGLDLKD